jgi:hypothetical protein
MTTRTTKIRLLHDGKYELAVYDTIGNITRIKVRELFASMGEVVSFISARNMFNDAVTVTIRTPMKE